MDSGRGTLTVAHVITGIRPHGAELALLRLVGATRDRCHHRIVVLTGADDLRPKFEDAGATVLIAGLSRVPHPRAVWRLVSSLRRPAPDVVQTWLPAADLLGGVLGRVLTKAPVVWNLRHSEHDADRWGWPTRFAIRANTRLSRIVPARIVAVGSQPAAAHAALGYDAAKMVVIPNGFTVPAASVDRTPDRERFGFGADELIVSRLGRFHDDKDFPTLLRAWADVVAAVPNARLALAGHGLDDENPDLGDLISTNHVEASVVALGELADPATLYRASDLTVSSSLAEGLPNVVGEAMAHGVPAVVTDAGDSARLVGDTGRVVPRADPTALAAAVIDMLTLTPDERRILGEWARRRIVEEFSMDAMADRYVALWQEVVDVRH